MWFLSNNYCLLLYVSVLIDKHVVNILKAAEKALVSHSSLIYVDNSFQKSKSTFFWKYFVFWAL